MHPLTNVVPFRDCDGSAVMVGDRLIPGRGHGAPTAEITSIDLHTGYIFLRGIDWPHSHLEPWTMPEPRFSSSLWKRST